ncbi:MAG TPA: uroporphyrinogen decarboxylase family protein, partial [Turneriella sp.]|nr:uroporphyrinogen decarboxylase family protein [Turneriella sp.]
MTNTQNNFDLAARGLKTECTPIWFMRQAGRYLPEYREIRKKNSFDAMLANADVATEVTLQPIRRFDLDAAVIFADIMTILSALDIPFDFSSGGPALQFNIDDAIDVEKLSAERVIDNQKKLNAFLTTIRQTRAALKADKAVVGFAAAPFTLLSYLIEGKTSKTHNRTRAFMAAYPERFSSLMRKITAC